MSFWREWTNDDVQLLQAEWLAGKAVRSIAMKLNRKPHAVVVKAKRLALPPHALVEEPVEPIPFDELDLVRLPKKQRTVLAVLLAAHPYGVTAARMSEHLFGGDDTVLRPVEMAEGAIRRLSHNLKDVGWECRVTGDRTGYRLKKRMMEDLL